MYSLKAWVTCIVKLFILAQGPQVIINQSTHFINELLYLNFVTTIDNNCFWTGSTTMTPYRCIAQGRAGWFNFNDATPAVGTDGATFCVGVYFETIDNGASTTVALFSKTNLVTQYSWRPRLCHCACRQRHSTIPKQSKQCAISERRERHSEY